MAVETRVMNCIMCPMGCEMTVTIEMAQLPMLPATPARVALNMLTMKLLLRSVC